MARGDRKLRHIMGSPAPGNHFCSDGQDDRGRSPDCDSMCRIRTMSMSQSHEDTPITLCASASRALRAGRPRKKINYSSRPREGSDSVRVVWCVGCGGWWVCGMWCVVRVVLVGVWSVCGVRCVVVCGIRLVCGGVWWLCGDCVWVVGGCMGM